MTDVPRNLPVLTVALSAALVVSFGVQLATHTGVRVGFGGTNGISAVSQGGATWPLVSSGHVWRLLSYALLHSSPAHLLVNVAVLSYAGSVAERAAPRRALGAALVLGTLLGGLAAVAVAPRAVVIGASGTAMAGLAFALIRVGRVERSRRLPLGVLLALGMASGLTTSPAALAAHAGGAAGGAAIGWLSRGRGERWSRAARAASPDERYGA